MVGSWVATPHGPPPIPYANCTIGNCGSSKGTSERAGPPIATLGIFEAMANLCSTPHLREDREEMCPGLQRPGGRLSGFVGWLLR